MKILGVVILIGLVMAVLAFFMGLDPANLKGFFTDTEAYGEMLTETSDQTLNEIHVDVDTRNIIVHYVEEDTFSMTYYKHESKDTWTFDDTVEGIFSVTHKEKNIFFNFLIFKYVPVELRTVNLYIPQGWVIDYQLRTDTGDTRLSFDETIIVGSLTITSDTGDTYVNNVETEDVSIESDTGNIVLRDVLADGSITLSNNTGNISLTDVTGEDITSTDDTGNTTFTRVIGDQVSIDVDTGRITLENSTFTGALVITSSTGDVIITEAMATSYDIESDTGDVRLTFEDTSMFSYDLKTDVGNIKVDGISQGTRHVTTNGSIQIKIDVDTGNIRING